MAVVVQDLVTKFSFLGSIKPLDQYNVSLGGSIKLLGGMLIGLEASAAAFTYWANTVLKGVDSLDKLSKETGIAVNKIQELDFIAGQTQSTTEAMNSTLNSLSSIIGSAAQKGSDDFARLGISVRDANGQVKTADKILAEVGHRFKTLNLSLQEQRSFASALGIDSSLLQMLNKSDAALASLRKRAMELGTLTAEQTKQADDYQKSLNSMWFSLNNIKQLIAVGMAPEMARMADSFAQLLADNRDWIVNGIQLTVKWGGNLLEMVNRLLPLFAGMAAGFVIAKVALLGFSGVMSILLSPIVLITAGVAALLLVADDLIVAFKGGKSVIADFFQDTFGIDIVDALTKSFQFLMKYAIEPLIDHFKWLWHMWEKLVGGIMSGGAAIAKFFGVGGSSSIKMGAGGAGNSTSTSNQINQNVKIDVKTADPQAAGRAIEDGLQRQLTNAHTQLGVGGR